MSEHVIAAGTVVSGAEILRPGWLRIEGDRVTAVGRGQPPEGAADLGEKLIVPGFVDIHVHGGGGGSFTAGDDGDAKRAADFHASRGTTTMLGSLVTARCRRLRRSVAILAELVEDGLLAGIHLEGPWLSERRCGAHEARQLRDPDPDELRTLFKIGRGTIKMITLAPGTAGALDAIKIIVDHGAVAALGHTDASYDQTRAAISAGRGSRPTCSMRCGRSTTVSPDRFRRCWRARMSSSSWCTTEYICIRPSTGTWYEAWGPIGSP